MQIILLQFQICSYDIWHLMQINKREFVQNLVSNFKIQI